MVEHATLYSPETGCNSLVGRLTALFAVVSESSARALPHSDLIDINRDAQGYGIRVYSLARVGLTFNLRDRYDKAVLGDARMSFPATFVPWPSIGTLSKGPALTYSLLDERNSVQKGEASSGPSG